jgi:hypothetical protein
MSPVASCKLKELEPWASLRDVLTKMAARTSSESLEDHLPDRWLAARPSHRWSIASLRQRAGDLSLLLTASSACLPIASLRNRLATA